MSTKKTCTTWELRVDFDLQQNKDCNSGDSTSDSWETAPKKQWRKVNIYDFREGGVQCNQALILQKVFY